MNSSRFTLEKIIVGLIFLLANLRASMFIPMFPDTSRLLGPAWVEILLWVLAAAGVLYLLRREDQVGTYLALWHRNWLLVVFILLACISIFWSIGPVATLFRFLEFFLATLIAAYFGMRFTSIRMMDVLFWFGAVLLILSVGLVYGAPTVGTMTFELLSGTWRGVYWHRNHLGSVGALLNILYLIRLLITLKDQDAKGILDGFFYLLSLIVVVFTRSATGYILTVVLHGFVLIVLLWLKISPRLTRIHYLWIFGLVLLVAIPVLTDLDFIFGLFGRDATMTGRTGLWRHMLDIAGQRPWLGHGFGAYWTFEANREEVRQLAGWRTQPLIADNGLLDIYLHLGIAGAILFVGVLVLTSIRTLRYAVTQKTLAGFFPVLVIVYALFANISFSLFAETEVFVWFLIVAVLFMTYSRAERRDSALLSRS